MTESTRPTAGPFTIRDARPEEWLEVGDIVVAAYQAAGLESEDGYLDHIRDVEDRARTARVLVAVDDDDRILGSVTYVPGPDSAYAETERAGEAGIRMLGVRPEAQGRGIGQALMDACIELARAEGRERIVLVTTGVFKRAARLYLRAGFQRARDRDFMPEPSIHLRGYELDLRAGS
jgi:GNAT superfamily N-acetyltransferase